MSRLRGLIFNFFNAHVRSVHLILGIFQEKNQSLSSTLMALSTQLGSLQVREEELSSMLKLKVCLSFKMICNPDLSGFYTIFFDFSCVRTKM